MRSLHVSIQALSTAKPLLAFLAFKGKTLVVLAKYMNRKRLLVPGSETALVAAVRLSMKLQERWGNLENVYM